MRVLKIDITDQVNEGVIRETSRLAAIVYKRVITYANKNKTSSMYTISGSKGLYHQLRGEYPNFPSGLISSTVKSATGAIKSWNTNNKKKRWQLRVKNSKYMALNFSLHGISLRGNLVTFSTVAKRQRVMVNIPEWFKSRYPERKFKMGIINYDAKTGKTILNLVFETPTLHTEKGDEVVGIDRGINHPIYTSKGDTLPDVENKVKRVKRKYKHMRGELQSRGTRSAKRRLKAMSGREERFVKDVNHCMSKTLASDPDVGTYVLEDLTGIRKRARKGKMGKKTRSWVNNWPFFQFQSFLEYKCADRGIMVAYVDPRYTSQTCNQCGKVEKSNRKSQSVYKCDCGWCVNADYNASLNIRDRYTTLSQ